MLQQIFCALYANVFDVLFAQNLQPWAWAVFAIITVYLIWYQWCFRIHPWLYPGEVAEVPYWIPCIYSSFLVGYLLTFV